MSSANQVERYGVTSRRTVKAAELQSSTFESQNAASNRGTLRAAASLASLMVATTAAAQEGGSSGITLGPIDVSGDQGGYQATQQTINRLQTPLINTPQTVNVVPQAVIQERRAVSMEDALRTVPGITFSAGEGGQQGDSPIIRGFAARGDIFRDGFRDPGWYTRDLFPIDRVEVYKGPSAFAFGRGSTGGAINNVSKWPTGQTYVEGTVTGNTGPGARVDLDAQGTRGNISGRIALAAQDYDTPTRDNVWTKRWGVAPSMTMQLDDATKATLAYIYQGEEGTQDYGQPYLPLPAYSATTGALTNPGYNGNGSPVSVVPVNRRFWYGITSGPYKDLTTTETHILTGLIERQLGNGFKLSNGTRYINNERDSTVTAPRALGNAANVVFATGTTAGIPSAGYPVDQMTIGRERRNRGTNADYLVNQTDLTGKFDTWFLNHTLAVGVEFSHEGRSQTRTDLCSQTVAICRTTLVNPQQGAATNAIIPFAPNFTTINSQAVYVNDQIKFNQYLEFLISLRNDWMNTSFTDYTVAAPNTTLGRSDNMFSQRYGVVAHPWGNPNASLYVAYGDSFNPASELGTLSSGASNNAASVLLAPEHNTSIEAGAKVDVLDNMLSLTGAVFRIDKTNLRIPNDPSLPTAQQFLVLDGLARVEGVEFGAAGKITKEWSVFAGYSYLESEIMRTTSLAERGRELPNTPHHNFNVWSTYELTPQFTVGGGTQYQSRAWVNTTNTAFVPDYWKFDAMASYKFNKNSTLQLNIYNITNAYYFSQYYQGHAVPASGRWASLSLRVKF